MPLFAVVSAVILIDDPGPVFFRQKRVGKDGKLFTIHKFRSMKTSAPPDVPTHALTEPERYLTRTGRFLRKTSLDELPQLWDILRGKMSLVGPRPALWNQEDLIEERDRYGANHVRPGLTGWAQIHGRDELEIPVKAALDGEYVRQMGLWMDIRCLAGTIVCVLQGKGVAEGNSGTMYKGLRPGVPAGDPEPVFGCDLDIAVPEGAARKVLVTGAGSYIGESFRRYVGEYDPALQVTVLNLRDTGWKETDFSAYDCVYHVAGIAHADVNALAADAGAREQYYKVNTDLAIEAAKKAKEEGVKQFVLMSSMLVYGESAPCGKKKVITRNTIPSPAGFYGDSKWQADRGVRALEDQSFHVAVIRSPMVYGRGCRGNYPKLAGMAKSLPFFPKIRNERSMLYVENLCEFLCKLIQSGAGGIFFPQNEEYVDTGRMVQEIGRTAGHTVWLSGFLNPVVRLGSLLPGSIRVMVNKAFGSSCYDRELSTYSFSYHVCGFRESIERTEGKTGFPGKALLLASVASMIDQFCISDIRILQSLGYQVDVAADFSDPGTITEKRAAALKSRLRRMHVRVMDIAVPRSPDPVRVTKAYGKVRRLLRSERYALIHCHSPVGGAICRLAAKKERRRGTKVVYTAHGFHFCEGASWRNWAAFYPLEKWLSRYTDVLITINREDYRLAGKRFDAGRTIYVPGVGVDTMRFRPREEGRRRIRQELGLRDSQIMILSVGELNRNKNHEAVIRALRGLPYVYVIVGKGHLKDELRAAARKAGVDVRLAGYREDVADFYAAADVYVLPSFREGLNVSLMEAMAAGLPVACSRIRGNVDLINEPLFSPTAPAEIRAAVRAALRRKKALGKRNREKVRGFELTKVDALMTQVYKELT